MRQSRVSTSLIRQSGCLCLSLLLSAVLAANAQSGLRKPVSGISVLGAGSGGGSQISGSHSSPSHSNYGRPVKGQVRNYSYATTRIAPSLPSALLKQSATKLIAEANQSYNEGLKAEANGDLTAAAQKLKHSVAIREYYWRERDKQIPLVLEKLARVYDKQNKLTDASETLELSLQYYTRIYGPGTVERIPALTMLGAVLEQKKDYTKSFDCLKQAYTLTERSKGAVAPETMNLRLSLARMAKDNMWYQSSADLYREHIEIVDKTPDLIVPAEKVAILDEYSDVLKKLSRDAEAREVSARAHPKEE